MIYFIYDPGSNCIKVGYSKNSPKNRLDSLQCGNPNKLVLIGWFDGTQDDELYIHKKLSEYKCEGGSEWFYANYIVIDFVRKKIESEKYNSFINIFIHSLPSHHEYITERKASYIVGSAGSLNTEMLPRYFLTGSGRGEHGQYYYRRSDIEKYMDNYVVKKRNGMSLVQIPEWEYYELKRYKEKYIQKEQN